MQPIQVNTNALAQWVFSTDEIWKRYGFVGMLDRTNILLYPNKTWSILYSLGKYDLTRYPTKPDSAWILGENYNEVFDVIGADIVSRKIGDLHLYNNHLDQTAEQLSRDPRPLPIIRIDKAPDIFSYQYRDFNLSGYDPHPAIQASVAV